MSQKDAWEKEYRNPKLVSTGTEPQNDVKRYLKFLKKQEKISIEGLTVLDLGSGTGRNANYLAHLGARVIGFEIAPTALEIAKKRAREIGKNVVYQNQNIGEAYPLDTASIDLALDITSSNALNEKEREVYLSEVARVVKTNGHFFVRALCKDGDTNAKELLRRYPGNETDTYIMPTLNLTERVFSKEYFIKTYSRYFTILHLEKVSHYARFDGTLYKRNYWLAYMKRV